MKAGRSGFSAWSLAAAAGVVLAWGAPGIAPAQGFQNIARTPGQLLAGPIGAAGGRAAIVAWHGERVVVVYEGPGSQNGADYRMRIVDINNLAAPQVTSTVFVGGAIHAHAYFHSGNYLFVGGHCSNAAGTTDCVGGVPGPGQFFANSLRIGGPGTPIGTSQLRRATIENEIGLYLGTYDRMATQSPWGANDYWTYNALDQESFFSIRRGAADYVYGPGDIPNGPGIRAEWNHLAETGVTGFAFLMGNILIYASDMAGTGVATYDVSDTTNPVLLDVLKEENPGGYWPEIYGHYIFFPRRDAEGGVGSSAGFMVVDFSDPTDLEVVHDQDLPGSNQYVTFQDEFAFMNNYKIDMRDFSVDLTLATQNVTGVFGLDASQFALPVGNLVITGGYGTEGPGIAVWAHQAEPDTRGPWVAYHIPRPDQTNYSLECPITLSIPETLRTETIINGSTLIVRPLGPGGVPGAPIPIWHSFGQGKLLTVTSQQPFQPSTTYEVLLTAGILDAAGNPMEPYSFRFSTGDDLAGGNTPPSVISINVAPEVAAPGVLRTFTWAGADPDGGNLDYRIDFGDGTPRTNWSTDTQATHTYTAPGHYNVLVQVRDGANAIGALSRGITVVTPPTQPNSTASSTMTLDAGLGRAFVVNSDNDTVSAINTSTLAKVWEAPTARHPMSIARAADGTLWVACRDSDAIDVLSATDGALVQRLTLPYGARPVAVCPVNATTNMLVSGEGSGLLYRYNTVTRLQTGQPLNLGPTPRAIAVNQAGTRAFVTRFISPQDNGLVYDVSLAGAMSLTRTISLRRDMGPDGSASSRGVPNYLASIRFAPNGDFAWVVGKKDNTTRGSFFSVNQPLGQDNTVRAQLCLINTATNAEDYNRRLDIDNSESPSAIAFSPNGDYAFIALQGNAQLAVIDMFDFMSAGNPGTVEARWETGIAPQGVLVDAATNRVFVNNFMDRTVKAFDAAPFLNSAAAQLVETTINVVDRERLSPRVLTGKSIFYHASDPRMSPEGYISCATCHIDGSQDGRVFDFTSRGEGFRNTTDLRGRSGTFHGNVHWTNNFDEIQDFENDIRNAFGGDGFLTDQQFASVSAPLGPVKTGLNADLDALAAYVASLGTATIPRSPVRNADGSLTASALNGQGLFNSNNCASCHIPSTDYTDRLAHNVGTLRASSGQRLGAALTAIDTPTLLGLHDTAPYFHDGSAATIEEVFTISGGRLAQAETGTVAGDATAGDIAWLSGKSWQQQSLVNFSGTNSPAPNGTVTFNDVQSTIAGAGFIEMRYSAGYGGTITVTVNGGAPINVALTATPNSPQWEPTAWRTVRTNVNWIAGVNTVVFSSSNTYLDSVLFGTAGDLAAANAHVRNFTPAQRTDLANYLRSLDGQNAALPALALTRSGNPVTLGATDNASLAPAATTFSYTIQNTGTGPLNLGQVHVTATPPGAITLVAGTHPAPTILPGGSTTLQLQLNVPVASAPTAAITAWTDAPSGSTASWTVNVAPVAAPTSNRLAIY